MFFNESEEDAILAMVELVGEDEARTATAQMACVMKQVVEKAVLPGLQTDLVREMAANPDFALPRPDTFDTCFLGTDTLEPLGVRPESLAAVATGSADSTIKVCGPKP